MITAVYPSRPHFCAFQDDTLECRAHDYSTGNPGCVLSLAVGQATVHLHLNGPADMIELGKRIELEGRELYAKRQEARSAPAVVAEVIEGRPG